MLVSVTVSSAVPPLIVKAGIDVDVEYTYIPEFIVKLTSVFPAIYPLRVEILIL